MTVWRKFKISVVVHTFICIICLLGSRFQLACGLAEYVPKTEINPSLDIDDHAEVVEDIEDITIAEQESVKIANLDYSEVQRIQPIDVIDDFIVPGSATKFSQLPHCSDEDEVSHARSDHAALLVSTLDGFLHSYDLSTGSKRWQHHLGHKKLHSCSSAMVELMYDGKQGSIVSSLDGFLYVRSNEQTFNALPVSVDSLVDSTFKISDDVVISGNKISTVYGLAASTGAELYQCDGEGCKQGEMVAGQEAGSVALSDSDDVLLIKKVMRNIYAADPLDGSPKFNLTAGLNHVELVRSGSCKAANRRGRQPEQTGETALPRPLFDRPQGKVWGVNKDGSKAWTKQLPTQIVDAWILDEGELSKLDLLQPINVPALVPRAHHPDTNVPGMYVGVHGKGEMFLHLSEQTKNKVQSYIAYNTLKKSYNWLKVEAAIRPSISWKPFLASAPFMMPAYGQGDMLAIEYKPDTIPAFEYDDEGPVDEGNTGIIVHYQDYDPPEVEEEEEDGAPMVVAEVNNISSIGFYLYDDDDLVISPVVRGGGGSSPHLSVPHTATRGSSPAPGGASTIPPGPWQPRFVQEEHLDPDQETEIPRHVHTWDVTWHLGVTSRHVQLLVAGLCLLLSLRVLYRPWYDSIVWLITLPLAYFVRNIVKDLLRRDPEVQADVYTASHGPQGPVLVQNLGRSYRARGPIMLPTNQNIPPRSEHSSQTTDHQLSSSLALDYGFCNKQPNNTTVETITEVGNIGGFDSGSSMDGQQGAHSHTNLTEYSPYTFVPSQGEVQQKAHGSTTSVQMYKPPRLQIPPPQGDFAPVYNVNIFNINVQHKTCSPLLPALENNLNPSPNSLPQSNGETSPPSVPSSTVPTSTPSTTALHPSASESSMTNTSGEASASPRSRIMDYDLRDVLGSGGFGIVFKAYLELDDHEYAIKRIPLPSKVENQRRVLREVRVLAKLNHMNIVRYYSCWQETHSTDWVREYDQPWRQKLKAACTAESFLSPVGDTTTSPTGSQTESSAALGRPLPPQRHSYSSTAAKRRRCQSEPPEQDMSTGIQEYSGDDLIVGQEYNPLYSGSSTSARKGSRHARSKEYATDNSTGSFSYVFGDGDGGNDTEEDDDGDSGCAKNGDEESSSSSSSSESDSGGAGLQMNLSHNSFNTNNKDNDDSYSIVFELSKITARESLIFGDNSDSIVFQDDSSSSSSSPAPNKSDVRPSDVSDSIFFQDPSSTSNVHVVDPTTGKRTVSEGNDKPVSGSEINKKRSKSVSVSRPLSLALRGQSLSDQSQSIKLYNEKEDENVKKPSGKRSSIARGIKDFLYIQMELCERKSLKEWLLENTDRPKLTLLKYFLDIVNAVEHVHDKRMMHRDLKPSNIFFELGKEDVVKVGDFGLGTSIADEEGNDVARTPGVAAAPLLVEGGGQHTQNAGTLSYMSPEQREVGKANYTYKVDIFSMGLILFEMLWVMRTSQEKSRTLQLVREMSFPPTFAEQHPEEHALLRLMLHEDPQQRPTTRGIRARQPLRRLQLPHHVDNIKEEEHFELIIKTHRRNTSSVSVTDLVPENEAPVPE